MRLALGGLFVVMLRLALACGAAGLNDGGVADAGVKGQPDAASMDSAMSPKPYWPSVVMIDGLVNGSATSTAGSALSLSDVRVCIFDANKKPLTAHALPESAPMPLASYPGVRQGGGIDLGEIAYMGQVTIAVFPADELSADAAWVTDRTAFGCGTMTCDSASLPCQKHVMVTTTLASDVDVIDLRDGNTGGITAVSTALDEKPYAGTSGSLYGAVVNFSGWHAGETVTASYGSLDGSTVSDVTLADPLVDDKVMAVQLVTPQITSYETLGIRFDQGDVDHFAQSLDSIAYVSNPTLTPPELYGVRENFVFALIGDPKDATSVEADGGRNPTFNRKGLHIVAVPYATPRSAP